MLKNDELERILNRVHEWIRSADQKISIFLAFEGILVILVAPSVVKCLQFTVHACHPLYFLLLCIGTGLILYSLYKMIFEALMPRVSHTLTTRSVLFFGDIASFKLADYHKLLEEIDDNEMNADFVSQIHASSIIASLKHTKFKEAVTSASIGFGLILLGIFALYFLYA